MDVELFVGLFLIIYLMCQLVIPIITAIYIPVNAKKHDLKNIGYWTTLGIGISIGSIFFSVFGIGPNMLVLSIFFFKTNRKPWGIFWLIIFIIGMLLLIAEVILVCYFFMSIFQAIFYP